MPTQTSAKTKPAKSKLNVKLLRKIQKHILEEPRRFFMDWYVATGKPGARLFSSSHSDARDLPDKVPPCGTAACIAGWAVLLSKQQSPEEIDQQTIWDSKTSNLASKLIGLPSGYWRRQLFNASGWPEPFRARYVRAKTPATRAKIAAARIEHLIKTGE